MAQEKQNSKARGTLQDIAQVCDVTVMTVSRALRDNGNVAEDTRVKILQAAEEIGYPLHSSRGRPRQRTEQTRENITVIIGNTGGLQPWYSMQMLLSIEQLLAQRGADCITKTCPDDYSQFVSFCQQLGRAEIKKALVLGYVPAERVNVILGILAQAILVDHTGDPTIDKPYDSVGFDNSEAARMALRHLLHSGRKNIVLMTGSKEHYFTREMVEGYNQTLNAAQVAVDGNYIINSDFTAEGAYQAMSAFIDSGREFDAVFTNDEMATGIYRSLLEKNLAIPKDVAVCGCDGLPVGSQLTPPLTTLVLDHEKLAQMAVERLFSAEQDAPGLKYRVRLVPELCIRASTAGTNNH